MKYKKLFILISRFPDLGSSIISAIRGHYFTHASIALEEDMNTFYSFVVKGFIVEKITRYVKPGREPFPCQLYAIDVPEDVYYRVRFLIQTFVARKPDLSYARIGMTLSLFHIPFVKRNQYFCSHFVAHILKNAGAVPLHRFSTLYFPEDFRRIRGIRLLHSGNMESLIQKYGLQAAAN